MILSPLLIVSLLATAAPRATSPVLRVCADPNNLPFSNERGEGFENRIAALVARELGARLAYTFWAQRRGFFRNTLKAGSCDVVIGVPVHLDMVAPSRPYYRSSYVFVTRAGALPHLRSFDDPRLRTARVGVPIVGDDGVNPPPAYALAARGIVDNVRGFSVYGDYAKESPPLAILQALARNEIDVAIVWGPLGGYFAKRRHLALEVTPVSPAREGNLPFVYEISLGVRRGDAELARKLDEILVARRAEIDRILEAYGVPRV